MKKRIYSRPLFQYTPRILNKVDKAQLYKEYSKLRTIAIKRIQRRNAAGYTDYYTPDLPFVQDIKNSNRNIVYELIDVVKFLESATSSVSAIKATQRKTISTLHNKGYKFITRSNIRAYGEMISFINSIIGEQMRYTINRDEGRRVEVNAPDQYKRWFDVWSSSNTPELDLRAAIQNDLQLYGIQL